MSKSAPLNEMWFVVPFRHGAVDRRQHSIVGFRTEAEAMRHAKSEAELIPFKPYGDQHVVLQVRQVFRGRRSTEQLPPSLSPEGDDE